MTVHRRLDRRTVTGVTEENAAAVGAMRRQPGMSADFADVFTNCRFRIAFDHVVSDLTQTLAAPGHRRPDFACIEQRMIVLRVADPDAIVKREAQRPQELAQSCCFADALREKHHPAAIEEKGERQLKLPNSLEKDGRVLRVSFNN